MKIEINGLHFLVGIISIVLFAGWLPLWPTIFIFLLGQFAAIYLTSFTDLLKEAESHDE